jgi:peptide-methionine (S)-S-oxide reductase
MKAVFYHDEKQRSAVIESRDAVEQATGREYNVGLEQATTFYPAEDYHQKYYVRQHHFLNEALLNAYPDPAEFRDATLSARLNALAGGHLEIAQGIAAIRAAELPTEHEEELVGLLEGIAAAQS